MFAGIFIGLGDILIFTVGGYLHDVHSPMTKIAVGMAFSVALSLIILLGSELFTSNNMVMAVGAMSKETSIKDGGKVFRIQLLRKLYRGYINSTFIHRNWIIQRNYS